MKIIEQNRSQADIILAMIKNRIEDSNNAEFKLIHYENGRELGYCLDLFYVEDSFCFDGFHVIFSENRNSDETVVYHDSKHFEGKLTEKAWENRKYFKYGDFIQTADYIISLMDEAVFNALEAKQEVV